MISEMLPLPPKRWPRHSIAYYTGQSSEVWGPDTIGSGMGGSEEAVIYLSRELSKLGWDVTVFCQREDGYLDKFDTDSGRTVAYRPWFEMNPQDEFDVFIASRRPLSLYSLSARVKLLDLHDAAPESSLLGIQDMVTKFMVKSNWHRSLYPNIPDDKFAVISNGILKEQLI